MTAIIVWFQAQLIEARARAAEEAEQPEPTARLESSTVDASFISQ